MGHQLLPYQSNSTYSCDRKKTKPGVPFRQSGTQPGLENSKVMVSSVGCMWLRQLHKVRWEGQIGVLMAPWIE